ncbi:GNAT family N-acetyltransferase [Marinicrinis lubricantis]|uniref:GNAT family N-acetyltransferase n=1 Tax=Marinicrinis lubricantis TaxID=2086470 RepID=A0ABW1IV58_9BACL
MGRIEYKVNEPVRVEDVIRVFRSSGIRRPVDQEERIQQMIDHSHLIISAWDDEKLIGVARALTDFSYCCYLSDLAVDADYQRSGIGVQMIERVKEKIDEQTALILLSAPEAMEYYPKIGFEKIENGFIIKRKW